MRENCETEIGALKRDVDLNLTTLGIALTLFLYASKKDGLININGIPMAKNEIDELLGLDDETCKRHIDRLQKKGFIKYRREYNKLSKKSINVYRMIDLPACSKISKPVLKNFISFLTFEARGLFLKMLPFVEKDSYVLKANDSFITTYLITNQVDKSMRSIERYIEEWGVSGLIMKKGRGRKSKLIVNPKIFNVSGKLSSMEKHIEIQIEKNKLEMKKTKEENTEKRNCTVIKIKKIHLKKGKPEDYDRKKMESFLPTFNETIVDGWRKVLYQFNYSCALTGVNLRKKNIIKGMEHFIPISIGHGGTNEQNVYPMISFLNSSKSDKNPFIWIRELEYSPLINKEDYLSIYDNFKEVVRYLSFKNCLTVEEFEQYVNWCFAHPRTMAEVQSQGNTTSVEIWKKQKSSH